MSQTQKRQERERLIGSVLIDPFRQIKFGLYVIGGALAFVLASAILFYNAFQEQYKHVIGIFSVIDPQLQQDMVLNEVFYANAVRLAIFFGIFLLAMFYFVFRLTHRYYGPLVSIARFLDEVGEGNYGARVSIRSKDELQDLAQQLNTLAEKLESRHGVTQPKGPQVATPRENSSPPL